MKLNYWIERFSRDEESQENWFLNVGAKRFPLLVWKMLAIAFLVGIQIRISTRVSCSLIELFPNKHAPLD